MQGGLVVMLNQLKNHKTNNMSKEILYSDAIQELEQIVSSIENEDVNVDELGVKVKRAAELINICRDKLHSTEGEVNAILKNLGG